jgi:hypothetical protein
MTWTTALLPDDALDPDSLVGRLLNPSTKEDLAKSTEPLPLWRVMEQAHEQEVGTVFDHLGNTVLGEPDRFTRAAEIEALRDWLPDMPPQDLLQQWCDAAACYDLVVVVMVRATMKWVCAQLTEQARVAREAGPH